jgi:mRNA interferase MazF
MEYKKDFDSWNKNKKSLNKRDSIPFSNIREVWWCSLGINIGIEIDGKNENYERPVLILKVFNKEMLWIVPLTSKPKGNKFYFKISYGEGNTSCVILSQSRIISAKRLIRKIDRLSEEIFGKIITEFKNQL